MTENDVERLADIGTPLERELLASAGLEGFSPEQIEGLATRLKVARRSSHRWVGVVATLALAAAASMWWGSRRGSVVDIAREKPSLHPAAAATTASSKRMGDVRCVNDHLEERGIDGRWTASASCGPFQACDADHKACACVEQSRHALFSPHGDVPSGRLAWSLDEKVRAGFSDRGLSFTHADDSRERSWPWPANEHKALAFDDSGRVILASHRTGPGDAPKTTLSVLNITKSKPTLTAQVHLDGYVHYLAFQVGSAADGRLGAVFVAETCPGAPRLVQLDATPR